MANFIPAYLGEKGRQPFDTLLLEPNSIPLPRKLAAILRPHLKNRASDAALIVQQIHYWTCLGRGVINEGVRWIYNSYKEWLEQMPWLTEWDFRIIAQFLRANNVVEFKQLSSDKRDRTGYYRINYNHEWLEHTDINICDFPSDAPETLTPMQSSDRHESYTQTTPDTTSSKTKTDDVVEEENYEEEIDEPTNEEVGIVCNEIRTLSPEIQINQTVRNAIRINWANVPAALAYIKDAVRTWKVKPDFNWTGLVVKALKTSASHLPLAQPPPQYPRPSLEQLESLASIGELVHTVLNEPGYPEVLAVQIGGKAIAWWDALKLGGES